MFVDLKWLKEWVEIDSNLTYSELAKDLVKVGLEEETIHSSGVSGPIVLGKVISILKEEQSNGKTINYCRVDVGQHNDEETDSDKEQEKGTRGIICGAHNFSTGDHVVVSLPGAILPGDFQIAARKTYGHISNGMICSSRELGLGDDHDGIIVIEKSEFKDIINSKKLGDDIKEELGLAGETLEINITPDRGYCFSYRGIAREFSHSTSAKFNDLAISSQKEFKEISTTNNAKKISVQIDDKNPIHGQIGCTNFFGALIEGVDPNAKTPAWMIDRLKIARIRPISLPVDITNYILMNFGQPLHAYDFDKVVFPIIVRRANDGEAIKTLDEKERELSSGDLLICDSDKNGKNNTRPIGIAGVMGGFDTEVSQSTQNVFIESAWFDPVSIARSARHHKLPSEASRRFERGVDPQLQIAAGIAAVKLFEEFGGENVKVTFLKHFEFEKYVPKTISFKPSEVARLLGIELSDKRIIEILEMIGCSVEASAKDWKVKVPSWRPDLQIPADLVEEIARINGYDEIEPKTPSAKRIESKFFDKCERALNFTEQISNSMATKGAVEVLSYPFISANSLKEQFGVVCSDEDFFAVANPLALDKPFLRSSILQSLISVAALNIKRSNQLNAIFETGSVFIKKPKALPIPHIDGGALPSKETLGKIMASLPAQPKHFAAIIFENDNSSQNNIDNIAWQRAINDSLNLIRSAQINKTAQITASKLDNKTPLSKLSANADFFHPGRTAQILINGESVGIAGELSPQVNSALKTNRAAAFEFNIDALSKFTEQTPFSAKPVSSFPPVIEDFAFVVNSSTPAAQISAQIEKSTPKDLFERVVLFDAFESDSIGRDKKSLAFSLTLRSSHKTLENEEIQKVRDLVISGVKSIGGELRS